MNDKEIEVEVRKNIEAYQQLFKSVAAKPKRGDYKSNPILTSLIYLVFGLILGALFYWGLA